MHMFLYYQTTKIQNFNQQRRRFKAHEYENQSKRDTPGTYKDSRLKFATAIIKDKKKLSLRTH